MRTLQLTSMFCASTCAQPYAINLQAHSPGSGQQPACSAKRRRRAWEAGQPWSRVRANVIARGKNSDEICIMNAAPYDITCNVIPATHDNTKVHIAPHDNNVNYYYKTGAMSKLGTRLAVYLAVRGSLGLERGPTSQLLQRNTFLSH